MNISLLLKSLERQHGNCMVGNDKTTGDTTYTEGIVKGFGDALRIVRMWVDSQGGAMSTQRLIEQETPFGMTVGQHLEEALKWLNTRSERLHHEGCSYHAPSARCNCGLHKTKTDLMAIRTALKEQGGR